MSKFMMLGGALAAALVVAAPASAANIVSEGTVNPLASPGYAAGGVRLRAFNRPSEFEVYLGRPDLGVGANRVQQSLNWIQNGSNSFDFSYDAVADVLSVKINANPTLNYNNFLSGSSLSSNPWNLLSIAIRDGAVGAGTIGLSNLALNGSAVSPTGVSGVDNSTQFFSISGDFKQSFQLTGNLDLTGTFGTSGEANRVEFQIGGAVPEPATWAMMIGGFGLAGGMLRRRQALAAA